MSKAIIGAVHDFIEKQCPLLDKLVEGIGVDLLGEGVPCYVIENTACDPIIEKYVDGSADKRFAFVFAANGFYGIDVILNIENIGFFEDFSHWMDVCTRKRVFPNLGDGRVVQEMNATITPYLYDEQADVARYQVQCELIYFQPAV
ncbi:MAG: chloramphenicol resistance protein [Eubacterium sp.]